MAAKTGAHRGEDLFGKGMFLARPKAREQSGGQHFSRYGLVDRGIDGPAAFAGILDEPGVIIQRIVLGERGGREIEQP